MKEQKGITLVSLVVTIVVLTIVTGMLGILSANFMSNTKILTDGSKYAAEFNKFNMYFIKDVKNNKTIYSITEAGDELVFKDGTVYTYKPAPDNGIYRNKVKICNNIMSCRFEKDIINENDVKKETINVMFVVQGSKVFQTNNEYVLRYW